MKHARITKPGWLGSLALPASSMNRSRRHLYCTIALLVITATSFRRTSHASDAANGDPWNIMVVPSRQTAFSGNARELFNRNCASCHSKDGRAQTLVARQRDVQDLSECKLEDAGIIEQILEGTHNKANTFKMPPFKDKLTRAGVESLVPLVKAFRPMPPSPSDPTSADGQTGKPRLVGIINLASFEYAVFEKVRSSGRYFMLREKESHDGVTLIKIRPKSGTVKLDMGGTNPELSLTLEGQASQPKRTGISGFFKSLGDAFTVAPQGVVLNGANADLVLFLYSQFTGLTLLRTPRLPDASFDLNIRTSGPNDAAQGLKKALRAKGITTLGDGQKFLLVVPESEAQTFKRRSQPLSSLAPAMNRPDLFPGGAVINLANADLSQVVRLYADLTGRKLDRTQQLPSSNATVNFTTQTPLTTEECAYALEALLAWHGLKVVLAGTDAFKVDLVSDTAKGASTAR